MPNTIRIKRRPSNNSANTLPELRNAELAFNEYKKTLYYGLNGASDGSATDATALAIAGDGAVWTGTATFGTVKLPAHLQLVTKHTLIPTQLPPQMRAIRLVNCWRQCSMLTKRFLAVPAQA